MRRVLHLRTVTGKGGGPEKTILNSPRYLRDEYEMRLAYIRPAGDAEYDMPDRAARMGVELVDIPERGPCDPRTVQRLAEVIRTFCPDIIHAHDYKTNLLAVLLGRRTPARIVTTLHGYVTRTGRLSAYYLVDRWSLRRMDHIIAVSKDIDDELGAQGIERTRRSLVENAIDTDHYTRRFAGAAAKERAGLDPRQWIIGAVGRLSPEKGFDDLIRSVDRLLASGLEVELLVAGEGDQRSQLTELIRGLGRQDRIRLLGHRSDLIELYEAMDVFVLSSLREGLPNVLLEAMAMEVPVVATRIAGVPRLVSHDVNGVLVEPGSPEDLSATLARLLNDSERRLRCGRRGRETVEDGFSFRARMEKIRAIYGSVLYRRDSRGHTEDRADLMLSVSNRKQGASLSVPDVEARRRSGGSSSF